MLNAHIHDVVQVELDPNDALKTKNCGNFYVRQIRIHVHGQSEPIIIEMYNPERSIPIINHDGSVL